jgi:hypothetical protein
MLHARRTLPTALWAIVSVLELVGLLTLDCLVDFGGREPTDFVSDVLDLGPRQIGRRPLWPVLFLTD